MPDAISRARRRTSRCSWGWWWNSGRGGIHKTIGEGNDNVVIKRKVWHFGEGLVSEGPLYQCGGMP